MQLTPVMEEIMRSPQRFKCVVAGRRFGKTWLALLWLLTGKLKSGERRWIVMPTYRQGKLVALPILKQITRNLPSVKVNESDLSVTVSGAEIAIKGSEDPSKLRGSHLNKVVLDEYAYMKKGVWEEVIFPMMTTTRGKALFIGTPDGFNNGFYDLFLKGQEGGDPDWKSWQFTSIDGGWIPKDEIDRARRNMDERIFKQEFMASFESAQNRVAYNFDRHTHLKGDAEPSMNFWCGMDFNVSKMVGTLAYEYSDSTIHYFDEIVLLNSNTEEMAKALREKYPKLKYIYPDPAGSARSTTSNRSDHAILKEYGFIVKAHKRHPSHRDRINALNRKLKDAEGSIGMTVSPKCKELIKDLEQCQRDMKTGGIDKSDMERTHALDACSYAIEYKYPVTVSRAYSVQW
jgi:phage terminase large subunit